MNAATTGREPISHHTSRLECGESGETVASIFLEASGQDQLVGVVQEPMMPLHGIQSEAQSMDGACTGGVDGKANGFHGVVFAPRRDEGSGNDMGSLNDL